MNVGVECTFLADRTVKVRRVEIDGRWQPVGQGRQWVDEDGRHVLIMISGDNVYVLTLQANTLIWKMKPISSSGPTFII